MSSAAVTRALTLGAVCVKPEVELESKARQVKDETSQAKTREMWMGDGNKAPARGWAGSAATFGSFRAARLGRVGRATQCRVAQRSASREDRA